MTRGQATPRTSGYYGTNPGSPIQIQAVMTRPTEPGTMIRRLRGVLPLNVATRKPGPLTIKLGGASGQTFRNDDVAVTIHEIRRLANSRQTQVDVSVRHLASSTSGVAQGGSVEFGMRRLDPLQQLIEMFDGQGKPLAWFQTSFDSEANRVTLTVTPQSLEGNSTPAEMRYHSLARASSEVAFEFTNLPLP